LGMHTGPYDEILCLQPDPYPLVAPVSNVEVSIPLKDVPDLLVLMKVFIEEHVDLFLIHWAHFLWRDSYFISVLVGSFGSNLVNV